MTESFRPAWWCRGPHLQTLWPYFFRRGPRPRLTRERLELPDGDFLDLDWHADGISDGPIVLVLHGLEGSSSSHYARGLLPALARQGLRGVVMHFRGCSGEPNRLPRSYHSGETSDIAMVVETLRARHPRTPIAVVGYSLGGNALLKWLGETGETNSLACAVAVSVPFKLDECANRLTRGFARVYQWELMMRMRNSVMRKQAKVRLPIAPPPLAHLKTFWDFDEHITAPLHGFRNAGHYYEVSSARQYLKHIRVPTLIVHAKDDPFMTPATAPTSAELSPHIQLELSDGGGHVGFVGGRAPWSARYWLEARIPSFLRRHLQT